MPFRPILYWRCSRVGLRSIWARIPMRYLCGECVRWYNVTALLKFQLLIFLWPSSFYSLLAIASFCARVFVSGPIRSSCPAAPSIRIRAPLVCVCKCCVWDENPIFIRTISQFLLFSFQWGSCLCGGWIGGWLAKNLTIIFIMEHIILENLMCVRGVLVRVLFSFSVRPGEIKGDARRWETVARHSSSGRWPFQYSFWYASHCACSFDYYYSLCYWFWSEYWWLLNRMGGDPPRGYCAFSDCKSIHRIKGKYWMAAAYGCSVEMSDTTTWRIQTGK